MIIFRRTVLGLCLLLGLFSYASGQGKAGGVPITLAPQSFADNTKATEAALNRPNGLAFDPEGFLYISEWMGNRVRRLDLRTGLLTPIAGTGEEGFAGDGGPATSAELWRPSTLELDAAGNLYIADVRNYRVRRVDHRTGMITTVAGTGEEGFSGDGGPATQASLNRPYGITIDAKGNLYIADSNNHRIRRVDGGTGIITAVAGTGEKGFSGDKGPATQAALNGPHVVELDRAGNLIIGDSSNQRIRRVDAETGIIQTIAGTGERGTSGDGGPATEAMFSYFGDIYADSSRHMILTDMLGRRIRQINTRTGIIHAHAGTGEEGFDGDGTAARQAKFTELFGIAMDGERNLYVADAQNHRVRRIDWHTGVITTIAGGKTIDSNSRQ